MTENPFPALTQAQDAVKTLSRNDPNPFASVADTSRALSTINLAPASSIAETLRALDTTKLINLPSIRTAAQTLDFMRPIVAPQIAEALSAMNSRAGLAVAETMKRADWRPTFTFAKTLDDPKIIEAFRPRLAESIRTLDLTTFSAGVAEMLRDMPHVDPAVFSARLEEAAVDSVALARATDVSEVIDPALGRFDEMSPAKRRTLALDVCLLIAAFVMLAGWFAESAEVKGAAAALGCAAALVRFYWRLTDQLD